MFGFGQGPRVEDLSVEEVKAGLADGSILLVDVREPNEWEAGHIPGSVLFPLSTFDPAALPEANGKRVVLSCRSGKRSLQAAGIAQAHGVGVDAHLAGGFLDWVNHGEPVETGS
ncbi:sulfurtransferase [Alsobacter soli]|uniref:Sulfurtransferase n=1 Tax=Alsobacter soli TaxID=2109933 RepID=A0A2T1HU52_9HYPH|nr:rhodanese-like domain-containing protein [Alsobacter soli]PSC05186.1 sulfurtransferase [Alsobacter soli]